jgi:NAD(P)-dependent dehydrogenase (short-subunit alcohol dehydrogenase family)
MTRIAVITGANQGIGYAVVEDLAARWSPDDIVLLTGRNQARVDAATERAATTTGARVVGRRLDVTEPDAVARLATELAEEHGGVDIVVSNAGARLTRDLPQEKQVDEFVDSANGGAHAVLDSFGPVLRPGGSLVVMASALGTLGNLDPAVRPLFAHASRADIDSVLAEWRAAVHDGTAGKRGWPGFVNIPSKVAQVALVRAVARDRRATDLADGTLVASICPGLVDTEASRPWFRDFSTARTPAQAAVGIVDFLLRRPIDPHTYGELVRDGAVLPWTGKAY